VLSFGPVSFLFAFVLPTTRCETRCPYCFYETGHTPRVPAADCLDPLGRALDALAGEGLQQVVISGGEPLLSPLLPRLCRLCNDRLLHVLLITRGERLDEAMLASLERWGVDDVTLSASSAGEDLARLVNRVLFRSRYIPTLLTCLTRENVREVPDLVAFSARRNLPHIFTPVFVPASAPVRERLSLRGLTGEEWERLLRDLRPWTDAAGTLPYWTMVRQFFGGLPVRPERCPMGTLGLVIDADGSVYPCFHRHDLRAGNLLHDDWETIHGALREMAPHLERAPCFGEHCLSLFVG